MYYLTLQGTPLFCYVHTISIIKIGAGHMLYRLATPQDIPILIELRKRQLIDEGSTPDTIIDNELRAFLRGPLRIAHLCSGLLRNRMKSSLRLG